MHLLSFFTQENYMFWTDIYSLTNQNFDEAYGPAWHCVVGTDFGSCITHLCGSFIFFRVEMMEFLVFKDGKDLAESKDEAIGVLQKSKKNNP